MILIGTPTCIIFYYYLLLCLTSKLLTLNTIVKLNLTIPHMTKTFLNLIFIINNLNAIIFNIFHYFDKLE